LPPPDVLIKRLDPGVPLPSYAHPGDAGADLTAAEDVELAPGQRALVKDACAAGTVIEAHVYPGHDHQGTVNLSLADSVPFVRRVFAGQPVTPQC